MVELKTLETQTSFLALPLTLSFQPTVLFTKQNILTRCETDKALKLKSKAVAWASARKEQNQGGAVTLPATQRIPKGPVVSTILRALQEIVCDLSSQDLSNIYQYFLHQSFMKVECYKLLACALGPLKSPRDHFPLVVHLWGTHLGRPRITSKHCVSAVIVGFMIPETCECIKKTPPTHTLIHSVSHTQPGILI